MTQLSELLRRRAPWFDASVNAVTWRTLARFERRLATAFRKGRCWLVGDAAHLTGPVRTHSMNVGFREAHELTTALAQVLHFPFTSATHYSARLWRALELRVETATRYG